MKKEFASCPSQMKEAYPGELNAFSWHDFIAGIPSVLLVVTSYKSNGRENACLQSWSTFVGDGGEYICIIASVSKRGHLYQSLHQTKCCVLNFPSRDVFDRCASTITHNSFEDDEITLAGLTAEKAISVNAPRIKECFLNVECQLLWMHEHFPGSRDVTVALRATHLCMDNDRYDDACLGRYGKTGYMYNINSPRNPDSGEISNECFAGLELYE